jgi:hypothetical protein
MKSGFIAKHSEIRLVAWLYAAPGGQFESAPGTGTLFLLPARTVETIIDPAPSRAGCQAWRTSETEHEARCATQPRPRRRAPIRDASVVLKREGSPTSVARRRSPACRTLRYITPLSGRNMAGRLSPRPIGGMLAAGLNILGMHARP